jgi:lipid-binding SYLF domain-containing protein
VTNCRAAPSRHSLPAFVVRSFVPAADGRDVASERVCASRTLEAAMIRRSLIVFSQLVLAASVLLAAPLMSRASADSAEVIDAKVNSALARFRKDVNDADEFLAAAKGVLVVPDVRKVGFVVAGQWGTGALKVGDKIVDYYRMDAGSAGLQAGYEEADFVFLFLTEPALDKFRGGSGWNVGTDAEVTVVDKAAGLTADTLKSSKPVMAFVLGEKGLMAGWSARGTKFSRHTPKD